MLHFTPKGNMDYKKVHLGLRGREMSAAVAFYAGFIALSQRV